MKQRITYLLREGSGIDPETIVVNGDTLDLRETHDASLEKRWTFDFTELPQEIVTVVRQYSLLHIRWSSLEAHSQPLLPLVSKIPAGLHVLLTPRKSDKHTGICQLMKRMFGTASKCTSVEESFSRATTSLNSLATTRPSHQYFQVQPDIRDFIEYLQNKVCTAQLAGCIAQLAALRLAISLDFDFDVSNGIASLTAIWPPDGNPHAQLEVSTVTLLQNDERIEVGVLAPEKTDQPEELKLGGYLTVLGRDSKTSATLFSFPSRHHPLPSTDRTTFSTFFHHPTGLHPKLSIAFSHTSLSPPADTCALYTYLTLPASLFIDRYQLSDDALLASNNLRALHVLSGADDLEAPEWAVDTWGSASLIELATPTDSRLQNAAKDGISWESHIPLHLRYLRTLNDTEPAFREEDVPWPIVFWACEADQDLELHTNPFDRVNLGYDGLFPPDTIFHHVPPAGQILSSTIRVPVLEPANTSWISVATLVVVLSGFAWALWSLLGPLHKDRPSKARSKAD